MAVNKIDKEGADPNRVRGEMAQRGVNPADWGGDVEFVDVSAKTRQGLDDLLDTIQVVAELEELKANPDTDASGVVIESKLDPGRGPVVTVLIQRGTLRTGDALVAGAHWGRVRAMNDFLGERVKRAQPGEPVEILGFDGVPEAGEYVRVVENDRRARQLAGERASRLKTEALARRSGTKVSLEHVFTLAREGRVKELNLVLKADVSGSLEAVEDEIARLPQDEVAVNVIHRGVGGINESDVMLAAASEGIVLGFNVRPVGDARAVADREGVEIRTYSVIYKAIDELRAAMEGMLEPEEVEVCRRPRRGAPDLPRLARRHDRRLLRHRGQGHPRRQGAARARRHRRLRRRDRQPASLQRRRARGRQRLRVRDRAARLPGRQGGRRARGLRDPQRRARARVSSRAQARVAGYIAVLVIHLHFPACRQPQGQAQGARAGQGASARQARRLGGRGRAPGHWQRATLTAALAGRSLQGLDETADGVERYLERSLPGGRRARRAHRWRRWTSSVVGV